MATLPGQRFYISPEWRFVVTDLFSVTLTFLDQLATDRVVTRRLNAPWEARGRVPSEHSEIRQVHTDGRRFLAEGDRLLFGFRREGDLLEGTTQPWWVRFAGIILQLTDGGDEDRGTSEYVAWDPWQYLYARPFVDANGNLPGPEGYEWLSYRAHEIVLYSLMWSAQYHGPTRIDPGPAWGGTGFWAGTIDTDSAVIDDLTVQQGMSVGQVWEEVAATGKVDIVLTPIYDPINRPGVLCDLSVVKLAGRRRPVAIFGWDKPGRDLAELSRLQDGTKRANKLRFLAGQGGFGGSGGLKVDPTSVARYGQYWGQRFFPSQVSRVTVGHWADKQLLASTEGELTLTISSAPERAPVPILEYDVGDRVRVAASDRLRDESFDWARLTELPLEIGDDRTETVRSVTVAPRGFVEP